ncbi:uncharacterized protein [Rhodnius prolixus]|uniref:uncharacterized protein n=1 Tax=Rhodnius prolixus TaxID=13249 RepID=UPI003D18F919
MSSDSNFIKFMQLTTLRNIRFSINYDVFMHLLQLENELNTRRQTLRRGLMVENRNLTEEYHMGLKQQRDAVFQNKQKRLFELLSSQDHIRKAVVREKVELQHRINCEALRIKEHKDGCRKAALANRELVRAKLQEEQKQCEFEQNIDKMIDSLNEKKDLYELEKLKASKLNEKMLQQFLINQIDEKVQLRKYSNVK